MNPRQHPRLKAEAPSGPSAHPQYVVCCRIARYLHAVASEQIGTSLAAHFRDDHDGFRTAS
jgi:hypothetical protein